MTAEHYNELIALSQELYTSNLDRVTNYLSAKYCAVGNDTRQQQMEDYLFVAVETSAYFLGNVLAWLTPDSQEQELKTFTENVRRVIHCAQQKTDIADKPS